MGVYDLMFKIMVTLGNPDLGGTQASQIIGLLQAPGRTCMHLGFQGGEMGLDKHTFYLKK